MELHEYHAWRKSLALPDVGRTYEFLVDYASSYHTKFKVGHVVTITKHYDRLLRYSHTPTIPADYTCVLTLTTKTGTLKKRQMLLTVEGLYKWLEQGKIKEIRLDNDN